MQKNLFLLFFTFLFFLSLYSQEGEPIKVKGFFSSRNRVAYLNTGRNEVHFILFLNQSAQLYESDMGYIMTLDEASAKKVGHPFIVIIPVNALASDPTWRKEDAAPIEIEVYPLPGHNEIAYYTKDETIVPLYLKERDKLLVDFWANPIHETDTLPILPEAYNDTRFIKLYINQLDNHTKVTARSFIHYFDDTGCHSDLTYIRKKISSVALGNLQWLYNSPFPPPKGITTKSEWLAWLDNLPRPIFEKPDVEPLYLVTPYNSSSRRTYQSKTFHQRKDNNFIYILALETDIIIDTKNDSIIDMGQKGVVFDSIQFKADEQSRVKDDIPWLKTWKYLRSERHIKLKNGDWLAALISSNGFEEQLHLYKIKEGEYYPYQTLYVDAEIPLLNELSIDGLYEAYGKYYVLCNRNRSSIWRVVEDNAFKPYKAYND